MKDDSAYLKHIRDAIQRIEKYTAVGEEVFFEQTHWQDAIIRQLEIIGEASKGLSAGFKDQHKEAPWRQISGLRDRLIHDYVNVNLNLVWKITQTEIPELKSRIEEYLSWF